MVKRISISLCLFALANVACGSGPPPPKDEISQALATPNAVVLDVRSPEEYASGHVPGAINLPVKKVSDQVQGIVKNKDTTIIVHCAAGGRSARATKALTKLGYTNIIDAKTPKAVADAKGVALTPAK